MIAALTAPIEMPAIQSISIPFSSSPSNTPGLIGAQRAAALKDEGDLVWQREPLGRARPAPCGGIGHRRPTRAPAGDMQVTSVQLMMPPAH